MTTEEKITEELPAQHVLETMAEEPKSFNPESIEQLEDTFKETIKDMVDERMKQSAVKETRPAMIEKNEPAGASMTGGAFKSFGEFAMAVANVDKGNIDSRLKVLGETQGDQGGFLVGEEYRAQLLSQAIEDAVIRPRAFQMPMTASTMRVPSIRDATHASNVHGGVQAYWTPESGSYTASEPTFAQVSLTAKKLVAYTTASEELLQDSAVSMEALLVRLFGEALAYFEDVSFISGVGGGQPLGIINADALISVAKETGQAATTFTFQNAVKMWSRMAPRSHGNAVWLMHPDVFPQLAQMSLSVGTGGSGMFVANAAGGPPNSLFGRPIIFTEKCSTLGTAGDVILADLDFYLIGDRQTLTMASSSHVRFQNGEIAWRLTERLDGRPWIDTALTPRNGSNTLSPFVALATRS
jgi:HK97 family phage major capsid protein